MKLFILFLSFSFALISCSPRDLEKTSLIPCFRNADTNNNNELDLTEMENFLNVHNDILHNMFNATKFMEKCDIDHDGKLTMIDLNTNHSCIERRLPQFLICRFCNDMFNK